ncbi:MAG: fluoride efflux transporter CrcB [Winogradskyella sp.]|nr:fluoride efflux transporter CrcB [Winogradskyella sp.]
MKHLILVFLGGGLGSALRYGVGLFFQDSKTDFPIATFAVNIIGSFLIGIILGFVAKNDTLSTNYTLLLATGFCGGFTTFSAFAYENHLFLKSGDFGQLALYTIGSLVIGFLAVFAGLYLTR